MGLLPVSVPARSRTRPGASSSSSSSTAAAAAAAALVGSSSAAAGRTIKVRPRLAAGCCVLMLLVVAAALWAGGGPSSPPPSVVGNQKMTVRDAPASSETRPPAPAGAPASFPDVPVVPEGPPTIPIDRQKLQMPQAADRADDPTASQEKRPQEEPLKEGSVPELVRIRQDDKPDGEFLSDELNRERAAAVRAEIQFAWQQYKKYAWGFDELNPIARVGKNWIGTGMGATIVDALDTLWLADLR